MTKYMRSRDYPYISWKRYGSCHKKDEKKQEENHGHYDQLRTGR